MIKVNINIYLHAESETIRLWSNKNKQTHSPICCIQTIWQSRMWLSKPYRYTRKRNLIFTEYVKYTNKCAGIYSSNSWCICWCFKIICEFIWLCLFTCTHITQGSTIQNRVSKRTPHMHTVADLPNFSP